MSKAVFIGSIKCPNFDTARMKKRKEGVIFSQKKQQKAVKKDTLSVQI